MKRRVKRVVTGAMAVMAILTLAACGRKTTDATKLMPENQILAPYDEVIKTIITDVRNGFPSAQLCVMDDSGAVLTSFAYGSVKTYDESSNMIPMIERKPVTNMPGRN